MNIYEKFANERVYNSSVVVVGCAMDISFRHICNAENMNLYKSLSYESNNPLSITVFSILFECFSSN
jgi:hypothetical protein